MSTPYKPELSAMFYRIMLITLVGLAYSCSSAPSKKDKKVKEGADSAFVLKELLIRDPDTAMIKIEQGQKTQLSTLLCQHWELEKMEDVEAADQVVDEKGKRIFPGLVFFNDSQVVENPRSHLRIGKWKAFVNGGKIMLELSFDQGKRTIFQVKTLNPHYLLLVRSLPNGDRRELRLRGTGYRQPYPTWDPFYPDNIRWMIKPKKSENDSLVYERTSQAVRFFALFYRDNIKKQQASISFVGLPRIFQWYSGGIGLIDRDEIGESWVECFYNRQQAEKGYELLRKLIVDNEFNWIKAPSWIYATHSVLEQMYLKLQSGRQTK